MGLFDFITKRQAKRREREEEKRLARTKRYGALVREIQDWVSEDPEKRVRLVCIAAVTGTFSILGDHGQDIEGAEADWRIFMAEHDSSEQSSEEVRG